MKFSAILLAAGLSSRMAGRHKLLLPINGQSVVRRCARILLEAGPEELVVVTGHDGESVTAALEGLAVHTVFNSHYEQGQMTSVGAGVNSLIEPCDAVMVCLADQALLHRSDYMDLVTAFAARSHGSLLVPQFQGKRGNPIMFASGHIPDILNNGRQLGCRKLIQDNPDAVFAYQASHDRYTIDMDTPDDYAYMLQRVAEEHGYA
jgi:molybdenum cofactor cytidylyltransferase